MKPGRNDPCICGSGKKYKICCQRKLEGRPVSQPAQQKAGKAAFQHSVKEATAAPDEYNQLAALFNAGHYAEVEKRTRLLLERYPDFPIAWKMLGAALRMQGKNNLFALQKAAELLPDDADTHYNLGVFFKKQGRLEEAEASYRQVLRIKPDFAEAHYNLGNTLAQLGRLHEAEVSYRHTLELKPDFAKAHNNLGDMLRLQDCLPEAEACYRHALELKPEFTEAHHNLALTLSKLSRLDEAVSSCRQALEIKPDFAEAHSSLARLLSAQGKPMMALSHYRKALDVSPGLLDAQNGICNILTRIVPGWHVPMLNEQKRNNAYFSALKSAITPDSEVFEIGTGSGLLAMMAAKLGARKVTTCEAEPLIAETAHNIVADNGYEKSIRVISKPSFQVKVGEDLPEKADILVSEIFSSELLGEYVLPCIEDAKRRLLKPRGRVIPAAGSIMVAMFSGSDIKKNLIVEDSFGFNLQRFNSIVSERLLIDRHDLNVELLTEDIEAFRFDFENDSFFPGQTKILRIPIKSPGCCYGFIQWIRLQMDKEIVFENHPSEKSPVSNWRHCAYVLPEPVDVKPGQVAVVSATHNRVVPWFYLDGIESA